MLIFADFHHSGAARGQVLALSYRLQHELWFPGTRFADWIATITEDRSILLPCLPSWLQSLGGVPLSTPGMTPEGEWIHLSTKEHFLETDWDAVLITRLETQKVFDELLRLHPHGDKIKRIAMTGNDGTQFDWSRIRNFMCSDELSYHQAPKDINKIWYSQEMGMQYDQAFVKIDEKGLHTINSFVNCWPHFDQQWTWEHECSFNGGKCPHCGRAPDYSCPGPKVNPYQIWKGVEASLPEYTFNEYGIVCKCGCVPEVALPLEYHKGCLSMHFKTYDGYGFSLLQAISLGRPVIVPRGFFKYRTAGKYLIPNLTCFEAEWSVESVLEIIRYVTGNLDRANAYAAGCWRAAKGLFNWSLEARRLSEFLEKLQ